MYFFFRVVFLFVLHHASELEELWSKLSLTEQECIVTMMVPIVIKVNEQNNKLVLMGKLLNRKPVNRETFKSFIRQRCKIKKRSSIIETGDDIFFILVF